MTVGSGNVTSGMVGCVVGARVVVGAAVVGAGGRVVRGRVTGGDVVVVVDTEVEVDSTSELVDVADDAVVVGAVVVVVAGGTVVDGDVSEVAPESVTEIRSTVGSAESSWNAAITTRLAMMTATNAPMNPLFLGTYPANRSGTSNSFRSSV